MGNSRAPGPALVAAAPEADPVARLVLGWLAAKRSDNTRTAYARDIGIIPQRRASHVPSWLAWCQAKGVHPVTGVTGLHPALYARQLAASGLSPASAARKLTAVAGWYDWLARRGHIAASPATGIARPKPGPRHPATPALTRDQALGLLHAADNAPGPQQARTAALVAVLLFTGARVSEVIGADVEDLGAERDRPVLWVTRGDGQRRSLALPGPAFARIDTYLAERSDLADVRRLCDPRGAGPHATRPHNAGPHASRPHGAGPHGAGPHGAGPHSAGPHSATPPGSRRALFATRTGGRLFAADVWRVVRRLAAQAGLPDDLAGHLGPEAMRHSFASLYLDAGGSLSDLQRVMGHADPRTTQRYDRARHGLGGSPGEVVAAYLAAGAPDAAPTRRRRPARRR
jgi:integrase/recombinase XerD